MSAWGGGSFENDNALDWAYELQQYDDLGLVMSTLKQAIDDDLIRYGDGFISTYNVDTAIAAAEVVAALSGRPSEALPLDITGWIQRHSLYVAPDIMELAICVVTRALNTQELRDLWADQTDYDEWKSAVEDLRLRLQRF
jgi:hypothetical protein